MSGRSALQSRKAQEQGEYLSKLRQEQLQQWDAVTGQSFEADTDPEYWVKPASPFKLQRTATIKPDGRDASTIKPLKVNQAKGLMSSTIERSIRRAVMQQARLVEGHRRAQVMQALHALESFLCPSKVKPVTEGCNTKVEALEALYAHYRQLQRETVSLMGRLPFDGRPPMANPKQSVAGLVNGQQVLAADRWQATAPAKATGRDGQLIDRTCRALLTVPMAKGFDNVWAEGEWNAAIDRGVIVRVVKVERSKVSNRPKVKPSKATASKVSRHRY